MERSSVEAVSARTLERSNARTLERLNARTLERSNARTLERSNARTLERFPHQVIAAPYPPVHYVLLAALEYLTNPEAIVFDGTQRPIFQPGRLLSLIASVSVALLLGMTVQQLGGSLIMGMVAASLWLAFPSVQLWATRIKADPLALAFTAVGLLVVARYVTTERPAIHQRRVTPALVFAAVAFALAFLPNRRWLRPREALARWSVFREALAR